MRSRFSKVKTRAGPLLLGLCAAASLAAWGQISGLFTPDVPSVSLEEVLRGMNSQSAPEGVVDPDAAMLLVDVRDDEEWAVSMIPGAVTLEQYEEHREAYAGRRIVAYCTVGYRSARYTKKLIRRGIEAVNFDGSIMAWVEAGQPLVTPNGENTRRVHTWSRHIKAPDGYLQVFE